MHRRWLALIATFACFPGCSGGTSDQAATMAAGAGGTSSAQGGGQSAGTGGVSGSAGAGGTGVGGASAGAAGAGGAFAPCMGTMTSTLPGVSLVFPDDVKCVYTTTEVSGGIKIPYRLTIDAPAAGALVTNASLASCEAPGPSGLFVLERLSGMGQDYCICDAGNCPPVAIQKLAAGTYPMAFSWDGKNWNGPSDTGNPKGLPFPAGTYQLTVKAAGKTSGAGAAAFEVVATLQITLLGKCGPCAPLADERNQASAQPD